ncbi:PR domain zinc finger protein 2 [Electrophorus electricus]|uniref:PR domain zinc finger protein 2 n=1 Tax=Electrophorus electricus TaxID=8005 RepID=UPI0015D087E4|nr:PR domain zinc finger protein 2 [Electrophorus electricus]
MAVSGGPYETLDDIPAHVWRGLPDSMRLGSSAVCPNRIGVWASRLIPKGKRFGPFVGERKKRSQVTSNVYMWEVYFPTRGWMCVDATDPMKGNWLRYVNWARSSQEQNLFPLEINRAIYYKVLRPIRPDDELLVWYNGEDSPEIAAALEEERTSNLNKKHPPRAKRARKKLLEKARRAGLGRLSGHKPSSAAKPTVTEMSDIKEGASIEEERPSASTQPAQEKCASYSTSKETKDSSPVPTAVKEQKGAEEADQGELQLLCPHDSPVRPDEAELENSSEQPHPQLAPNSPVKESSESIFCERESSLVFRELDAEGDPDLDDDAQGETHPCQHCERHFSTKQGLERHTHIHTMANHQTNTFKCRYCSKPFGSQVGRRRHERRHESGSKGLKRLGALSGTVLLLSPSGFSNSPTSDVVTSPCPTIMSSRNGPPQPGSGASTKDMGAESDPPFVLDEIEESKEVHPCKYCNKAFGTHTNMRRHQRRIHERHLMPKGVRRKGILLQDGSAQQLEQGRAGALGTTSPTSSPPPTYVPSVDTEDEGEREEGMVDISRNISENLSLYIDGKILSTSSDSGCEVIEVDSNAAALFGLDAVILNPNQINQVLKVETRPSPVKELSLPTQSTSKRRTSTPPLLPAVKMESETVSSTAATSSSPSPLLGSSVFPQSTETLAFQKEKAIYLSPKLKQLLQAQDSQKSSLALIADSRRLTTPLSITSLPAAQGRFKRRTGSPLTPVQSSPSESSNSETGDSLLLKVPKVESHSVIQSWSISSKDQRDSMSPPGKDWSASISGGNSCNQQPLDLSSAVAKKDSDVSKGPGESVLDLSVHRKGAADHETKASILVQAHVKRKKPNTSMLEKVLMNEYTGLSASAEEGCPSLGSPDASLSPASAASVSPSSPCSNSEPPPCESASPPSLTPVIMNPSSPSISSQASSTPPPPVLPSVPSPPPLAPSSDCSFPKLSPKPVDHVMEETPGPPIVTETCSDSLSLNDDDLDQTAEQLNPTTDALPSSPQDVKIRCKADSISDTETETLLKGSTSDSKLNILKNANNVVSSYERRIDSNTSQFDVTLPQDLNIKAEVGQNPQSSRSPVHLCPNAKTLSPSSHNLVTDCQTSYIGPLAGKGTGVDEPVTVKKTVEILPSANGISSAAALARSPAKTPDVADTLEQDTFVKSFVCNVCEEPFNSIKELSSHIIDHATERPFKCEFCVQLFGNAAALLEHRSSLHGVGRIYVCSVCSKEFAFLCNLQQHQSDLHPGQSCDHTSVENGKLRPQNYTDPAQAEVEKSSTLSAPDMTADHASLDYSGVCDGIEVKKEAGDDVTGQEDPTEELYTTIKIMASEAGKPKGPDVRLGINQHYPSFKPPPFPYHNRTPAGEIVSATNFTTHNIPQTFSTAIRCTKCGNSFDNMPELHKHILACANASDKRRYTPKKNPIPLRQIVKPPLNGAMRHAAVSAAGVGQNTFRRMGQPKRLNFIQEMPSKMKMTALNKKKNQLVQKAISQKNKAIAASVRKTPAQVKDEVPDVHVCPYCSREFTYPASLTKHIACSCPQKPVAKKKKGVLSPQDKNMKLRSRATDSEIKQEPGTGQPTRPLGKTRARSSEPLESDVSASRGKVGASQVRAKRPASSVDSPVHKSKKGRKSSRQSPVPLAPVLAEEPAAKPAQKPPRAGKDAAPKKEVEMKPQVQSKKEERFSVRVRERVGGPVTRSLQMASSMGPGGTDDPANGVPGPGE